MTKVELDQPHSHIVHHQFGGSAGLPDIFPGKLHHCACLDGKYVLILSETLLIPSTQAKRM